MFFKAVYVLLPEKKITCTLWHKTASGNTIPVYKEWSQGPGVELGCFTTGEGKESLTLYLCNDV